MTVKKSEVIISQDKATAEVLHRFFINFVPHLKISMENDFETNLKAKTQF